MTFARLAAGTAPLRLGAAFALAAWCVMAASGGASAARFAAPDFDTLVRQYRRGECEAAVRALLAWSGQDLDRSIRASFPTAFDRPPGALDQDPNDALAASLLLLEAGTRAPQNRAFFDLGQALVESPGGRRTPPRVRLLWYLLAATSHHARGELTQARRRLDAGLEILGRGDELLTALGALLEAHAGPFAGPRDPGLTSLWDRTRLLQQGDPRDSLVRARRAYQEALELRPGRADARVRLGWVSHLLGSDDAALRELEPLLESAEPDARYLARIFTARILEPTDAASAERHYRLALRELPPGQVAAIGLARLLHDQGRRAEAVDAIAQPFVPSGSAASRDPWWDYPFGGVRRMASWMDEARAAVRLPPNAR